MARAAGFPVPASLNTPQEILEAAGRIRAFLAARNS
jgi:hypothetical protein